MRIPVSRCFPVLFLLLWSGGFVFLRIGLRHANPLTFLALRYACVVALLLPLAAWMRPAAPRGPRGWGALLGVGLFLQAGYFAFVALALRAGLGADTTALVTSQQPVLMGLLAPALAGEHVSARRWVGLLLGVTGASLVVLTGPGTRALSGPGLLFAVAALPCMAAGTLTEKRFGGPVHPVLANLVQCAVGLVVLGGLAAAMEPMRVAWSWQLLGALAYLVLGNSLLAISLLLAMIRHGEASRVSALFFLVPPCTAAIAFLVLGEQLGWASLLGMALAVAGIGLVTRSSAGGAARTAPTRRMQGR